MATRRQDGWWYPWTFVGGMAVVIAVNVVLTVLAVSTFPGIETEDHYERGVAYNDALAGARAQAALGWSAEIRYEAAAPAGIAGAYAGQLVAMLNDKRGQPVSGLDVDVRLVRPTHDGFDTQAKLARRGDGAYASAVTLPLPGQWDAHLVARKDGVIYQESHRLFVK